MEYTGKKGKQISAVVDWPLLWSIQLATEDQLEAEGQVGKS